jgi:hypothetical protein
MKVKETSNGRRRGNGGDAAEFDGNMARLNLDLGGVWQALISMIALG